MDNSCFLYAQMILMWIVLQGISIEGEIICGHAKKHFESCFANGHSNSSRVYSNYHNNIPVKKEEIQEYCNIFDVGLRCYNDYANKCIQDPINRRLIEGEVMPAKNFYEMLCKDNAFKKDYLHHRDCFRYVEKDWVTCTRQFQSVMDSEFTRTEREKKTNVGTQYIHFCCARYAYEICVFNSAKAKCKAESAVFTRKIVELLSSEKQFQRCDKIEDALCSATRTEKRLVLVFPVLVLVELLRRKLLLLFGFV